MMAILQVEMDARQLVRLRQHMNVLELLVHKAHATNSCVVIQDFRQQTANSVMMEIQ